MSSHDFFEHRDSHHGHGHDNHTRHFNNFNTYPKSHHNEHDFKRVLLEKVRDNPRLKALLIFGAVAAVVIVILLIVLLFPLLQKLVAYISENGLKSIIDSIWKGSK